jgi:predicted DNA-binding transcriptional regulator YafY
MRADRLVSLVLLLQARGLTAARVLAAELDVSVRTIYRDLEALSAAGVPIVTDPGPGGGCRLLDDYRFPLRGLRPDEAEALLILGVPQIFNELGLGGALAMARRRIQVTTGVSGADTALVHLDMPRWFAGQEEVPELRTLARAVRRGRLVAFRYRGERRSRIARPLGLVNKAGIWYLVARTSKDDSDQDAVVFRVSSISLARELRQPAERPAGFELAAFWTRWSAEFAASLPRVSVVVRAAPEAVAAFPEVLGDGAREAIAGASEPDQRGWRVIRLSFDHEIAAAYRLAGFGGSVEVLRPAAVRDRLVATACAIVERYAARSAQTEVAVLAAENARQLHAPVTTEVRPASRGRRPTESR